MMGIFDDDGGDAPVPVEPVRSSAMIHGVTTCEGAENDGYSVLRMGPRSNECVFFLPPGVAVAVAAAFTAAMSAHLAGQAGNVTIIQEAAE